MKSQPVIYWLLTMHAILKNINRNSVECYLNKWKCRVYYLWTVQQPVYYPVDRQRMIIIIYWSGLVVESGHGSSNVTPIFEGFPILYA